MCARYTVSSSERSGSCLAPVGSNPILSWLVPKVLPLLLHSPLLPRIQRRLFFWAPLPPLDPAFRFQDEGAAQAAPP